MRDFFPLGFPGPVEVRWLSLLRWERPRHYKPTCLYHHALTIGRLTVFWKRDYSGRGLR